MPPKQSTLPPLIDLSGAHLKDITRLTVYQLLISSSELKRD